MTLLDRYKHEIIEAAKFLETHPDWEPDESLCYSINTLSPDKAIGYIVEELTED